jgi:Family of unknown function (DUF5670)
MAGTPIALVLFASRDADLTSRRPARLEEADMLWTIFVILLVLWLLGMVSSYTMGGFIHILLVVAIVVVLINLIQGRRVV